MQHLDSFLIVRILTVDKMALSVLERPLATCAAYHVLIGVCSVLPQPVGNVKWITHGMELRPEVVTLG